MVSQVSGLQNASNSRILEFVVAKDIKCMRVVMGSLQCWSKRDCRAVLDGSYYFSFFFSHLIWWMICLIFFSPFLHFGLEDTGFIVRNGLWFVGACWGYLNVNVSRNSSSISMLSVLLLWSFLYSLEFYLYPGLLGHSWAAKMLIQSTSIFLYVCDQSHQL